MAELTEQQKHLQQVLEQQGTISQEIKWDVGFGYDPVFVPKGQEKSLAETPEWKEANSHRFLGETCRTQDPSPSAPPTPPRGCPASELRKKTCSWLPAQLKVSWRT